MKNNLFIIIYILIVVGIIAGVIFLTNAIINSDLPDLWKWFLLK